MQRGDLQRCDQVAVLGSEPCRVLTSLGFDQERRHLPVDRLSGRWRNRAMLALILVQAPDVLLLNEPTNFLDLGRVRWIDGWLSSFAGTRAANDQRWSRFESCRA